MSNINASPPGIHAEETQARKYLITINNYIKHGFPVDKIKELAEKFRPTYFCLAEEIGAEGTPHVHLFIQTASPVRFSTVKKRFPTAHIDVVYGTAQDNRNYIRKEGRFADTEKAETRVEGSFYEWGQIVPERKTKAQVMPEILELVKQDVPTMAIIERYPEFMFKAREIDALREMVRSEKYSIECRDVKVHYVYGDTGTGKTKGIYNRHGMKDVCRITDYSGPYGVRFDAYHGQKVLVLEEFHSQIDLPFLLNLLDFYPVDLSARYYDRVACFDEVYITSNIPLEDQYVDYQIRDLKTYKALLRRITDITYYDANGSIVTYTPRDNTRLSKLIGGVHNE